MSGSPADASLNGDGFRFYRWEDPVTGEVTDVLSVTSIRRLCGESFNLVNWQMANLADAALGTMKRTVIGPRGGVTDVRQVWEYPSEFAKAYADTDGAQGKIDELRKWLRAQADAPRNIAAARGTLVHEAIEKGVAWDRIERSYVEAAFSGLSSRDRAKIKRDISDDDINFIRNGVRQYWAFRAAVPMLILAAEVQVWNLTAGYAGTFDALAWVLGTFEDDAFTPLPEIDRQLAGAIQNPTAADVAAIGGTLVLLDWKTAAGVYTDNVVQAHAYLAAEFVGTGGVKDERLTALLASAMAGGLVHIRPNSWALHLFSYEDEVVRGFLGSVAFARLLAKHPTPTAIFTANIKGASEETDE